MSKVASSYYIEPIQKAKLEILAGRKRVARSKLVREALEYLFEKYARVLNESDALLDLAERAARRAGHLTELDIDRLIRKVRARKKAAGGKT